jgi:arylsulfatase A-like enzyme
LFTEISFRQEQEDRPMSQLAIERSQHAKHPSVREDRVRSMSTYVEPAVCPKAIMTSAVWLGLVTGLLEVAVLVARRHLLDAAAVTALQLNQHARWMIPVSHGLIFAACGLVLAGIARFSWARRLLGTGIFGLCFLSAMSLLLIVRGLTTLACSSLAAGIALWIAPVLRPRMLRPSRLVTISLPPLFGVVALFFSLRSGREKLDEICLARAAPNAPNVLFIVLDTVRAESLSLHGYHRDTSPNLADLAQRGVKFDDARTAAAWTLPSHASMFTGRWPHELSTCPDRPLDETYPTLAEFLRDHGYVTAGFAANTYFCSLWYGLGRGFLHYEDVALTPIEIIRSSIMGRYLARKASPYNRSRPTAYFERKDAMTINREALDWLANRPHGRPFFVFLNYYDAHDPYLTPKRAPRHFGRTPERTQDLATLRDWLKAVKTPLDPATLELARDGYDDCIAYLDNQLGRLFAELESRALLENTLVIITADHGELIGERGEFGHGQSLHHEVANVPLLLVAPRRAPSGVTVPTPVSLRDLPATVVDLLGLAHESPFPGCSLARHWTPTPAPAAGSDELLLTEAADAMSTAPINAKSSRSLVEREKLYIRNKDGREELYDLATDPTESHDLADAPEFEPLIARFRETMHGIDIEAERLEKARRSARKNSAATVRDGDWTAAAG